MITDEFVYSRQTDEHMQSVTETFLKLLQHCISLDFVSLCWWDGEDAKCKDMRQKFTLYPKKCIYLKKNTKLKLNFKL